MIQTVETKSSDSILIGTVDAGQIVTKRIPGPTIPDQLLRDGWVELHRDKSPKVTVVIERGSFKELISDLPRIHLQVIDLDSCEHPDHRKAEVERVKQSGMFTFEI